MSASHFFVGLGAGLAILAVPVATLTPGLNVPQRIIAWIDAPPTDLSHLTNDDAATGRPLHGYRPGDPTPAAATAVPTVRPYAMPTPLSTRAPVAPAVQVPSLANMRWAGTGVIRSGGNPVVVRRVPGVESSDDVLIADGSPVLVSVGPPLQVGADQWRAIRGLNGVVGWVPRAQLAVDGETPIVVDAAPNRCTTDRSATGVGRPANVGTRVAGTGTGTGSLVAAWAAGQATPSAATEPAAASSASGQTIFPAATGLATTSSPAVGQATGSSPGGQAARATGFASTATCSPGTSAGRSGAPPGAVGDANASRTASPLGTDASDTRGVIANTAGSGVVLRNSPNDADRTPRGLMDGAGVTVLEYAGADWVHVRADNGQTGWIPAQYLLLSG